MLVAFALTSFASCSSCHSACWSLEWYLHLVPLALKTLAALLEEEPVTHFVVHPKFQEEEAMFRKTLKSRPLYFCRETHPHCVGHEGPRGSDTAERLVVATAHLFEDVMIDYHPRVDAGEVAGKSYNTQWASRQLWKK